MPLVRKMQLKSAVYLFTACAMLGLVMCIEKLNADCYKKFGGVNFMAWVVRIMLKDSVDPNHRMIDLATGNIITEFYVVTACSPFLKVIEDDEWRQVRVAPTVNDYSKAEPDRESGVFPYAGNISTSGCVVAWYNVSGYELMSEEPCNPEASNWPDKMLNNLILLRMGEPIHTEDDKLFPRMPFSYQSEPIIRKIDWFNMFRKARCIIARLRPIVPVRTKGQDSVISPLFDWRGFHYKTLPYRAKCAPAICDAECQSKTPKLGNDEKTKCVKNCTAHMQQHLGTLMCIVRMDEKQQNGDKLFSVAFDLDDKQQEYNKVHTADRDCEKNENNVIMGSPVVCSGEAIAIVTKCSANFLVATSIVHVRHHILEKFDTSYMEKLEFLSYDKTDAEHGDDKE